MKSLFSAVGIIIFLFLASPAFAEEPSIFLTNQNGERTTQFEITDKIYVEGICLPANKDMAKIFIAPDKTWQEGDKLFDVSASIESFAASADGVVPRTLIWANPLQGKYDVLIDSNNDYILQGYEQKCIIGLTGAGFQVGTPVPPPAPPSDSSSSPSASSPPASPPPASSPSTKPSKSFSLNDYVETNSLSNVRKSAGGTALGTQAEGALGIVIGGPTQASLGGKYFWFWKIDFENDPDGWVSESNLKSVPVPLKTEENNATTSPLLATTTETAQTVVEETPQEEGTFQKEEKQTMLSQISAAFKDFGSNPLMGSIIIGAALFAGLVISSIIISRAIKPPEFKARAQRQPRRQTRRRAPTQLPRRLDIVRPNEETLPPQP